MKTKLFLVKKGFLSTSRGFGSRVEREINTWLEAHPKLKIVEIVQSASGGYMEPMTLAISVWYEDRLDQL
jgi:hypothetical protein